jgi:hypothetical protein
MRLSALGARRRAASADHGMLCTLRADGRIDAVPACFALDGDLLAVPIDRVKPKAPGPLQRTRNLAAHPEATFLCERWDAGDWARLWWVRFRLRRVDAEPERVATLEASLRSRYRQYAAVTFETLLVFQIREATGWSAV